MRATGLMNFDIFLAPVTIKKIGDRIGMKLLTKLKVNKKLLELNLILIIRHNLLNLSNIYGV
jgi:hypothetical protein